MKNELRERYTEYLSELNIHLVRSIARQVGVNKPTDGKKERLIERIIDVLTGKVEPVPTSRRGAPLKEIEPDPKYVDELNRIKKEFDTFKEQTKGLFIAPNSLDVNAPAKKTPLQMEEPVYAGVLEIQPNGSGTLHTNSNFSSSGDLFISTQFIRQYNLLEGDRISCLILSQKENNTPSVKKIFNVNETSAEMGATRVSFDSKLPKYPNKAIGFAANADNLSLRVLELFCPIGRGQRVLLHVPADHDYTSLSFMRGVADDLSLRRGTDRLKVLCLLIDEQPEAVSEFIDKLSDEEVFYTTFDQPAKEHVRMAKLIFSRAKRLAENGSDVVLFVNSLAKLTKAYSKLSEERQLPCGLSFDAVDIPKQYFSLARRLSGGGSITIFTAVSQNEESMADRFIEEEFTPLANAQIYFDQDFIVRHITPSIDLSKSITNREESFLSDIQIKFLSKVRPQMKEDNGEKMLKSLSEYADNYSMIAALTK